MKFIVSLIFTLFVSLSLHAQVSWEEFIVYDNQLDSVQTIREFEHVEVADLDNDGDMDILGASIRLNGATSSMLTWYRNEGNFTFSGPNIIFKESGDILTPFIDVGDIDGDGDIDVAYVTSEDDKRILWFENKNNGAQFEQHLIANMFFENCGVLRDMDGDGDLDVLTAGTRHTEWYRNIDGKGDFSLGERFYEYFDGSRHLITGEDYDEDGDPDIIYWRANGGSWGDDNMYLHYNEDGQGNFGSQILLSEGRPPEIVDIEFMDIDNDGEKDIVFAHGESDGTRYKGQIYWNKISNGQIRATGGKLSNITGLTYIEKVDIDKDGDLDIITSTRDPSDPFNVGMYLICLNNGNGQFESPIRISHEKGTLEMVKSVDLNNDGLPEIVGVSKRGISGIGLEFMSTSNEDAQENKSFIIFPNPIVDELIISPPSYIKDYSIEVFNMNGQSVLFDENKTKIRLGGLPSGTYLLQITDKFSRRKWSQKVVLQ